MEISQGAYENTAGKYDNGIGALLARPYMLQIAGFRGKVPMEIDKGEYVVKTAENEFELEQALRLRHDVFIVELLGRKKLFGIDIDRYDMMCDHLMVVDKLSGACVGTYRLNSNLYSTDFYSESEFHLGTFPKLEGRKLEIGRACIRKDLRKSNMMGLLWEGIYAYMGKIGAQYVFGCSSIMTTEPLEIALAYRYLKDSGFHTDELGIQPRKKYAMKVTPAAQRVIDLMGPEAIKQAAGKLIPRLIVDYLKFGARVCGEPAVDKNFRCADVFTVLDLGNLNNSYKEARFVK